MPQTDNFIEIRVGHFIREHRKKKRMNQDVFGDAVGINRKTLLKLENGERLPSGREIFGLCDFLKITPNDLLSAGDHVSFKPDHRSNSEIKRDDIVQFFQMVYSFFRLSPKDKTTITDLIHRMAKSDLEHGNLDEFIRNHEDINKIVEAFLVGGELGLLLADIDGDMFSDLSNIVGQNISSATDLAHLFINGIKNGDLSNLKFMGAHFIENLKNTSNKDVDRFIEIMRSEKFEKSVSHLVDLSERD